MNRKAVIFGIKSYQLTYQEKKLFKKNKPWGIILFSRNINNIFQLRNLVYDIKKTINDNNFPILIDQEGGRISRLNNIIDFSLFSQNYFGQSYVKDKKNFINRYKIYVDTVCNILRFAGININTVPVLDVRRKKSNNIIGDRSFSMNEKHVSLLGKYCIELYKRNKIATVIKHIPGHGATKSDSHYKTPTIKLNKRQFFKKDFIPFKMSRSLFAMTAHVIYKAYDKHNTATHSKTIIKKIIRDQKHINFNGLLITDDISMKSLKKGLEENALKAIKAGCNLVLHCNGNIKEMHRLSKVIPKIDKFTQKKTSHFYKFLM